ncbi:MAG TPA: peroxiredoxin-like family protein [Solirubrobacteraceae bacterium]|nr:peroxiredoxin-like family protein [Solirubrobacteraceae bacterium]HUA70365.1 peroxiredoxin-like family protein [Solirubrobacteraceae bacterium]
MITIAEQANEVKAVAAGRLPAEVVAAFASDQAALLAGGIPAGAVSVGEKLAPFALADATGESRTLDELAAEGPLVIVFYRGGWCPYCNVTLRSYERDLVSHLAAHSARLVAISPETPDASLTTQEKAELSYTVLSDPGAELASSLGITFEPSEAGIAAQRTLGVDIRTTRADRGTMLPMPTVLIVDRDHVVRFVDIHPDYTGRTEVDEILAALDTLRR